MIVVYEAPNVMDITYRVAKLLKAHGASVTLTHYNNKRGIMDPEVAYSLPPASTYF